MSANTDATIKGIKNMSAEVSAWEGRLAVVKSQVESLQKQKDALVLEMDQAKARHNKEIEDKHAAVRSYSADIDASRRKLDADKSEFESILLEFKKERNAFEREKQSVLDMKTDTQRTFDRVSAFIVAMRNEAAKI